MRTLDLPREGGWYAAEKAADPSMSLIPMTDSWQNLNAL